MPKSRLPTPSARRILFVDDLAEIIECWRWGLEQHGYSVSGYADPYAAIEALRADPAGFDLLVTDLAMPQLTGIELIEGARRICPALPVIVCSGYCDAERRQTAALLGIEWVLEKPVRLDELVVALDAVLGSA